MAPQPANPEFFAELKEWSARKLELIKKYLDAATKILGSIDQVYYIDGFAGGGAYGELDDLDRVPGSPLQAVQLAEHYEQQDKLYSLRCINIEEDLETYQRLEEATAPYKELVKNIHGTFADSIDEVLAEVGSSPIVGFLDPFGVKGMDWSAVQKLIRRNGITDLWIRFDAKEVRRRDGYYGSSVPGADKQFEILMSVYGIADAYELHKLLNADTPQERKQNAVQLYMARLRDEFGDIRGEGFAEAYRIGSLDEEEKYYLVFATAGKKGFVLASNIVYGIEENYQKEIERYKRMTTTQLPMFQAMAPSEDDVSEAKIINLENAIWEACTGQTLSRLDIHTRILDEWFGIIKGPHVTRALKQLKKEKRIVSVSGPISRPDTLFEFRKSY